jgi:uncharacterized protein DUF5989
VYWHTSLIGSEAWVRGSSRFAERPTVPHRVRGDIQTSNNDAVEALLMDFLKDLWGFLNQRKKLWLLPAILVLLVFGTVIVLTGGTAIAPFIYTLF